MEHSAYKKILVGLDGSEGSLKALGQAIELARLCASQLHTISVVEVPGYPGTIGEVVDARDTLTSRYDSAVQLAIQQAGQAGLKLDSHVVVGHEVKSIVELVRENNFDLLVVGFMGHSALYDRVMGSTCQGLVRLAPCNVLVVK
jgi:nucleotide-binding universal stress UspA family protein